MKNDLKARLANGEICVGAWVTTASSAVAEAMASCGFDWLAVDLEHGTASIDQAREIFIAAERHGVTPMARLSSADPIQARRLLDAGAKGLIVPVVEDTDTFAEFASHCLYPPRGKRGVGLTRATRWTDDFEDYLATFKPVLVPQVETLPGVEAATTLAALPEVDAIFLGPYDLSASIGTSGDFTTEAFIEAAARVRTACEASNKPAGIHQVKADTSELKQKIDEGFRFLAYGTDLTALKEALGDFKTALS